MVASSVSIGVHGPVTSLSVSSGHGETNLPADILGQVERLQMEVPSSSFSRMTRTKFQRTR
jgi:hypothetical protein